MLGIPLAFKLSPGEYHEEETEMADMHNYICPILREEEEIAINYTKMIDKIL